MNTRNEISAVIEIPLESVQSESYSSNIRRSSGSSEHCIICGKQIKDTSKAKYVHLLTNGNLVSYSGEDIEGSQGFFPVGIDCAKKLIINFSF